MSLRAPICSAFCLASLTLWVSGLAARCGTAVTDAFVAAVAQIESRGGRHTVGDAGQAKGWWQMHEPAWQDTSAFRSRKGLPVWDYDQVHDPEIARLYARDYLISLENQIRAANGQEPTVEMIYAAYNVGFGRFQALGFSIEKTRPTTRASCARLRELISAFQNSSEQTAGVSVNSGVLE